MSAQPSLQPDQLDTYVRAVIGKKAESVVILGVQALTSLADAFIVCSGRSNRQVMAIAEHIKIALKKQGRQALRIEGLKEGHWVLMDYGDVIIHIFYDPVRRFYDLEGLWADAPRLKTPALEEWQRRQPSDTFDPEGE
ncbi:MAG: ribosome silencing factor [Desulfobacterales bacterium]|nr:ribosome silencing factor [Desulfobacterales bacterium]